MTDEDKDLVTDLLVQWEEEFEAGREVTPEELCTEYPHLTETVRQKIDSLKRVSWTKRDPARPLTDQRDQPAKDISGTVLAERYQLDQLLGSGGYGQVYRATDLKLRRPVAVKIGHHRTSCDLLLDEARRVARCPKHPGIVGVHDCGEHSGRVFLVFEYVAGQSLADVVRTKRPTEREAVELVATVAESLSAAHKLGLVHRDLKPENILLDEAGQPMIADFGVACTLDDVAKGRAGTSGTLQYMSPEILSGDTQLLDGRCDIHSLGVVLFELLAGQPPFPAKDKTELREQILFRPPTSLRQIAPNVSVELEAICSKAMAKHPGDRYGSVDDFAAALRNWLDGKEARRRWLRIFGLVSLVSVVGLVTVWLAMRPSDQGLIRDGILHFDGRTRIVTNVQRTLPVTLEAWVKPDPYRDENCQFIIGSDVPGKYGLGIAICGSQLSAEYINGMINSPASVVPGEWSHVASVFTESETRLYLNGKLVANGPGSAEGIPANFVIGNVGQNNLLYYFRGQIRSVRISERERYIDRFKPAAKLIRDETTLLAISEPRLEDEAVLAADVTALGQAERVGK
ncbi:protein kinase domain-containing protein [Rubinisphaera brasiliensis]|uniref:Serine/threonine protein kinase n=1 Tax=Rubinisphaera brasiliensis (strain ATCC 49424 / DSM 5305 / JCM 21570 / IAM 15109 / NBRC 103401 / IFAM 1448) TaxID=756272 RepID=F0SIF7_RUBBR|nr:protein kinase [Rubinisphaera brasiliensis]ADY58546.1 serine/threonine protein kinase [Rubinisphaera brasiliensis DSM 5305]